MLEEFTTISLFVLLAVIAVAVTIIEMTAEHDKRNALAVAMAMAVQYHKTHCVAVVWTTHSPLPTAATALPTTAAQMLEHKHNGYDVLGHVGYDVLEHIGYGMLGHIGYRVLKYGMLKHIGYHVLEHI
jgi:hypothetical protein